MYNATELNALGTSVETHSPCNLPVNPPGFSSLAPELFLYIYIFLCCNKSVLLCVNVNSNSAISSLFSVFWPHVYPVGLLPWSEGSDNVTHSTETHLPGAASAQCWYVQASFAICAVLPLKGVNGLCNIKFQTQSPSVFLLLSDHSLLFCTSVNNLSFFPAF